MTSLSTATTSPVRKMMYFTLIVLWMGLWFRLPPLSDFQMSKFLYEEISLYNETYATNEAADTDTTIGTGTATNSTADPDDAVQTKTSAVELDRQDEMPETSTTATKRKENNYTVVGETKGSSKEHSGIPSPKVLPNTIPPTNEKENYGSLHDFQKRVVENPSTYMPRRSSATGNADDNTWSSTSPKQPLVFLNIPGTMWPHGDVIERAAAKIGLSWGRCTLHPIAPGSVFCSNSTITTTTTEKSELQWWQMPIPFQSHKDQNTANPYNQKDAFVVVCNPYVRVIVQYFEACHLGLFDCKKEGDAANAMNERIQTMLEDVWQRRRQNQNQNRRLKIPLDDNPLWIPQFDYIYATTTTPTSDDTADENKVETISKVVRHVLQIERLDEQFLSLMAAYDLKLNISGTDWQDDNNEFKRLLIASVSLLTSETRSWIERVYSNDFALGDYLKIEHARRALDPDQAYLPVITSSEPYSWKKSTNAPRRPLGFLHIPKTAGTTIESAAAAQSVSWGLCLFHEKWEYCPKGRDFSSPHILLQSNNALRMQSSHGVAFWHVPIQYLPVNRTTNLNYNPNFTDPYAGQDVFAVIRNPYKRAVSEYYYYCHTGRHTCFGPGSKQGWNDTAEAINHDIQSVLKGIKRDGKPTLLNRIPRGYFARDGHWIPQYDFLFDDRLIEDGNGNPTRQIRQMSHHVIHFEHMHDQFHSLVDAYGLQGVNLTSVKKKWDRSEWGPQQTVASLTTETRLLIEEVYALDFEVGSYIMLEKTKALNL